MLLKHIIFFLSTLLLPVSSCQEKKLLSVPFRDRTMQSFGLPPGDAGSPPACCLQSLNLIEHPPAPRPPPPPLQLLGVLTLLWSQCRLEWMYSYWMAVLQHLLLTRLKKLCTLVICRGFWIVFLRLWISTTSPSKYREVPEIWMIMKKKIITI